MNEQARHALTEALRLAEHGYRLTPVTITRLDSGKKAARFHRGWRHEDAWSHDPDQIRAWWTDHPDCSFALGGAANGIEGVDLDYHPDQGVDGVEWWSAQGLPLSPFVQVTPSGGMHLIWRAVGLASLPQEAGVTFGKGVDTRNRAGLFFAAGAYVLGEDGHYAVQGTLPKLADLDATPPVVLAMFAEHGRRARELRPVDGRIVVHDEAWQQRVVGEALQAIREHDRNAGGYRAKLMGAGLLYGRAVEQGFTTAARAEAAIVDAHRSVWGDTVFPENLHDVRTALADGPRLERWRVPAELQTIAGTSTVPASIQDHVQRSSLAEANNDLATDGATEDRWPGETGYDPDAKLEQFKLKADAEAIERERRTRMARRVVAAEEREPVRVLSGLAFMQGPDLSWLVPGMLYRASTAKVFGPPGGTKSFLLLDLVMSMATGRPWRGIPLGRHRVHYVMAEGEYVNRLRARAWLIHHGVDEAQLDGWLTVVPEGFLLTSEGVAEYLTHVEHDQPALVVLDTKNAMMDGDESSASDNGVMIRALRAIRDAAAGACVVLVDHTGLNDETRSRGSNASLAAMDTEIRVSRDFGGTATAEVTRDKGGETGRSWTYRLHAVRDVPRAPGIADPAVCVETERGSGVDPFGMSEDWFTIGTPLPDDVATWKGKGAKAVPALARFMRYSASSGSGFSFASARKAVQTRCRDEQTRRPLWSDDTLERAWDTLAELGRLQLGTSKGSPAMWLGRSDDPH